MPYSDPVIIDLGFSFDTAECGISLEEVSAGVSLALEMEFSMSNEMIASVSWDNEPRLDWVGGETLIIATLRHTDGSWLQHTDGTPLYLS